MKRSILWVCATALLSVSWLPAWPHAGEDHGDDAPQSSAAPPGAAPRTSARTDEFELVAVLSHERLNLYLDRYETNEPVAGALVEIEHGASSVGAQETAPGVYSIPSGPFSASGRYSLTISVQAGDTADLLGATLEVAAPASPTAPPRPRGSWADPLVWGASGALVLGGVGVAVARRRGSGIRAAGSSS